MTATIPVSANTEMVAKAWLQEILQDPTGTMCGQTLPGHTNWAATGFVQVSGMSGSRDPEVPINYPVVSVDVWVVGKNGTNKPPYGLLNDLTKFVMDKAFVMKPHRLTLPGNRPKVQLFSVECNEEARRVPDIQAFGRMNFPMAIAWAPIVSPS